MDDCLIAQWMDIFYGWMDDWIMLHVWVECFWRYTRRCQFWYRLFMKLYLCTSHYLNIILKEGRRKKLAKMIVPKRHILYLNGRGN